jgi:hypothetical protein
MYFQLDTLQGTWNPASGSNPSYTAKLQSLEPGFHVLYAFADDGETATSAQTHSPGAGSVQAYGFGALPPLLPQSISFVGLPTVEPIGASVNVTVATNAPVPVTFSSPSPASICTVAETTYFYGVGTCTVVATAQQTTVYASATVTQNITVVEQSQTITFGTIPTQSSGTSLALFATSSSGLPVTFTSTTPGVCTVTGDNATLISTGACTIVATQPGNALYAPATPVTQTFTVAALPLATNLAFIPVAPCRLVDTRNATGAFGGPSMTAGSTRSFTLPNSPCGLPLVAYAYSLNITVVPQNKLGYLTVWPTGLPQPLVSTLNSLDGRIVANAAIVPAGSNGAISVYVTDQTEVIIDVNGYFGAAGGSGALTFVPVNPCRAVDTRSSHILAANSTNSFPVASNSCGVPTTAAAYSLNATVIPTTTLDYLTLYPTGAPPPNVSTLNSSNGQVVANAAIVPAGTGSAITAYVTNQTQLILDINGYFTATPPTPLVFNTVTPCRVVDTRNATGTFGGPILAANSTRSFPIPAGSCGIPATATAYAFNVTVVPTNALQYLTLWANGQAQPNVSTLNSYDGQVVSNAALVPAGTSGAIDVFVTDQTHVIIDVVGYFSAP